MNYIKQLENQLAEEKNKNLQLRARIQELRVYLAGPKFQGELNDYINVKDVYNWISYITEDLSQDKRGIDFELLKAWLAEQPAYSEQLLHK